MGGRMGCVGVRKRGAVLWLGRGNLVVGCGRIEDSGVTEGGKGGGALIYL